MWARFKQFANGLYENYFRPTYWVLKLALLKPIKVLRYLYIFGWATFLRELSHLQRHQGVMISDEQLTSAATMQMALLSGATIQQLRANRLDGAGPSTILTTISFATTGNSETVRTPLQHAAVVGGAALIESLVQSGAALDQVDQRGNSALHLACQVMNIQAAHALIKAGANKVLANRNGQTPRNIAESKRQIGILMPFLLAPNEALPEDIMQKPHNFLIYATNLVKPELMTTVLEYFPDMVNNRAYDQNYSQHRTPLNVAVDTGNLSLVQLLIDKGANVNLADLITHQSPLMRAAFRNYPEITALLIRQSAFVNQLDASGRTALFWAVEHWCEPIIRQLLNAGANVGILMHNETSIFDIAANNGHLTELRSLIAQQPTQVVTNQRVPPEVAAYFMMPHQRVQDGVIRPLRRSLASLGVDTLNPIRRNLFMR